MRNSTKLFIAISFYFFSTGIGASPTLPGEKCKVAPHSSWTKAEAWAWGEVCEGNIADFNVVRYEEDLNPLELDGWNDTSKDRRLSQAFITTILLHDPWKSAIPRQGVLIAGAFFPLGINLDGAKIEHNVWLGSSRFGGILSLMESSFDGFISLYGSSFEKSVLMDGISVKKRLVLSNATFKSNFVMPYAQIGRTLEMDRSAFLGDVTLSKTKIDSSVVIRNASFEKEFELNGATVGGDISIYRARFLYRVHMDNLLVGGKLSLGGRSIMKTDISKSLVKSDLYLRNAKVQGSLFLTNTPFGGVVLMDGLQVGANLGLWENKFDSAVTLSGATIGGWLRTNKSHFKHGFDMSGLQVNGDILMPNAIVSEMANLRNAKLGANFDLSGAEVSQVDLTGAQIFSELRLGASNQKATRWRRGGELILRNARARSIQDQITSEQDSWPTRILFDGFTYEKLGGLSGSKTEVDMMTRDINWYVDWLARNQSASLQPYEQLAKLFRNAGYASKANDVLYAGRERERSYATGTDRIGYEMLNLTIGYGIGKRYFRALWWIAGLVALGMLVLRISGEGRRNKMPYGFSFSLDHLLPIVTLRKYHFDVTLNGWPRYYFYFHKLMGYVLASFLIAGMAGLTQ